MNDRGSGRQGAVRQAWMVTHRPVFDWTDASCNKEMSGCSTNIRDYKRRINKLVAVRVSPDHSRWG